MQQYHFTAIVDTEAVEIHGSRRFMESVRDGAREALGQTALDRLSRPHCEFISVEIFDDGKTSIAELRLKFGEVVK